LSETFSSTWKTDTAGWKQPAPPPTTPSTPKKPSLSERLLRELAAFPSTPPTDAGPTPTSAPLASDPDPESLGARISIKSPLRREVILISSEEDEPKRPKDKGKKRATREVEMEIAQDEQRSKEEGRIFDSIPEQLFLRP
jgi:hypothetical protein